MEQAFYFIGFIVLFFAAIYLGTKCFDWYAKYRADKFQTNTAHFLSDLYRLQNKWASAGEFGFAETCANAIKLHGNLNTQPKIGGFGVPITNDALATQEQLKRQRKEDLRETIEEFIG